MISRFLLGIISLNFVLVLSWARPVMQSYKSENKFLTDAELIPTPPEI